MKNLISFLIVISLSSIVLAQSDSIPDSTQNKADIIQTLFSNPGRLGWWVSPDFAWSQISKKDAFLFGLSGGIIIKHSFSFGLAGYGIVNSHNLQYSGINDTADVYLYGGYGGFKLEYRIMPLKLVNVGFPLLIGGGGVSYTTWNSYDWHNNQEDLNFYTWDSYFVLEPGIVFGINMLKFMRLDLGASYRYTSGIDLPKTESGLLTGFNFISSLKFGRF